MGSNIALDLAESINTGLATLDQALIIHLRSNHYPPLPLSLLPTCKLVIQAINEGDYNREITLPDGITWRGKEAAPAGACLEAWHLSFFCDQEED